VDEVWNPKKTPNANLERFLERQIFPRVSGHLVWAMDETDRLFDLEFKDEFSGLMRSWYNERQINPDSEWSGLTILIAYANEPHLFITNLSQSPFNIGLDLPLADFTQEQVDRMNKMYGSPLRHLIRPISTGCGARAL
jgi:AAA-like domain